MNIPIIIPSRGRSQLGTTWNLFPQAILYVHESEYTEYSQNLPEKVFGVHNLTNLAAIRNSILNRYPVGSWVILMDDDIKKVGKFTWNAETKKAKSVKMEPADWLAEFIGWIEKADKQKYHLVGPHTSNPLNHDGKQFKISKFIDTVLIAIKIRPDLRYDEVCQIKNGMGINALVVSKGWGSLRLDYLWRESDYHKMSGGCQGYRTPAMEQAACQYLTKKYPGFFVVKQTEKTNWDLRFRPPKG